MAAVGSGAEERASGARRALSLLFPGIMGIGAVLVAVVCLYSAGRWGVFLARAETASAVVERIEIVRSSSRGVSYRPWFRLESGELARSRNQNGWRRYEVSQAVVVRRDSRDRAWAEADSPGVLLLGPLTALMMAPLLAGVAWLFLPGWVTGADRLPLARRTRWGVMTTTERGAGLPGRLKLLLVGSGSALAALVALSFLVGEVSERIADRAATAVAEGEIVMVRGYPAVRFEAAGGPVTVDLTWQAGWGRLSAGERVAVRYRASDPGVVRPDAGWRDWRGAGIAGAALVVVLGFAGWVLRRNAGAWWRQVG